MQNILGYRHNSVIPLKIYLKNCNNNAKYSSLVIIRYWPHKMIAKWTHFNCCISGWEPKRSLGQDHFVYTIKYRKVNVKENCLWHSVHISQMRYHSQTFHICITSRYVVNMHPDKVFTYCFQTMCIHELPQNIEQKQDNYVCNFLQKPLTETSYLLMNANGQVNKALIAKENCKQYKGLLKFDVFT